MPDHHESLRSELESLRQRLEQLEYDNDALRHTGEMLEQQLSAYWEKHIRDPLTGLFHRRYLHHTLEQEIKRATRRQRTIGLLKIDVDNYSTICQRYGRQGGESLLRALAMFLQTHIRTEDVVCRYEGKEFLLLLSEASLENTYKRAREIYHSLRLLRVQHQEHMLESVSFSIGIAAFPMHGSTVDTLAEALGRALTIARAETGDRLCIAEIQD